MARSGKIPTLIVFAVASAVVAGEVAAGTSVLFAEIVGATLICIATTYNLLGGTSTISGMAFAAFALCTLVISQFAKVVLWQAADKSLESPQLTIKVYFVFYICVLIGCFTLRDLRFRLQRPACRLTQAQSDLQYSTALLIGLAANLIYEFYESSSIPEERSNAAHSISLALTPMLLYSLVLAVKRRIEGTGGRHSFGLRALLPWSAVVIFGLIETSRAHILLSTVTYAVTCHLSGFQFRKVHYCCAILLVLAMALVISPFEMLSRGPMRLLGFEDRIREFVLLSTLSSNRSHLTSSDDGTDSLQWREDYFDDSRLSLLDRMSAVRLDSNMINACASGFHYGLTAMKIDALRSLPRFFGRVKPDFDGSAFTGRVTGVNPDEVENGEAMITLIGDSFGSFGWLGVVGAGFLVLPFVFIVYESVFDIGTGWGALATAGLVVELSQVSLGGLIGLVIRTPITLILISYAMAIVTSLLPIRSNSTIYRRLRTGG